MGLPSCVWVVAIVARSCGCLLLCELVGSLDFCVFCLMFGCFIGWWLKCVTLLWCVFTAADCGLGGV